MSTANWHSEPHTLSRSYAAEPESVPAARRAVVEFAEDMGMDAEQIDALRLAASEAVTNAVRHAYPDGGGTVQVTAALAGEELWVLVADDGQGLSATTRSPGLGLGLALIASVSDYFAVVNRSGGGTEVRMRFGVRAAPRSRAAGTTQRRGSLSSASRAASSRFSTTR